MIVTCFIVSYCLTLVLPFFVQKLKSSLEFRKTKYVNLQDRITYRTKVYFTHFLHQRDYHGKITFNHEKERLDIEVKVDCHTDQSKATKNTKALSGGERSFTTICFIMSLWEAMEAPFRCLDEFDVFMVCLCMCLLACESDIDVFGTGYDESPHQHALDAGTR